MQTQDAESGGRTQELRSGSRPDGRMMTGMLEYDVHVVSPSADDTRATVEDAVIVLDTSDAGRRDAANAAELLLTALATCMTKGVRRAAAMNHFEVGRVEVHVHGIRQDSPPKISQIRYQVLVETDETDQRLDLLHRNVRKFGTVTNTVAPGTDLDGTLERLVPYTHGSPTQG